MHMFGNVMKLNHLFIQFLRLVKDKCDVNVTESIFCLGHENMIVKHIYVSII